MAGPRVGAASLSTERRLWRFAPRAASGAAAPARSAAWAADPSVEGRWRLTLSGDWNDVPDGAWPALPREAAAARALALDTAGVSRWDADLVSQLWALIVEAGARGQPVDVSALGKPMRDTLALTLPALDTPECAAAGYVILPTPTPAAAPAAAEQGDVAAPAPRGTRAPGAPAEAPVAGTSAGDASLRGRLAAIGRSTQARAAEALVTAGFIGDVLLAALRLARGKSDMRRSDFWRQVDRCGPNSLPIVALSCGLIGLMLAYMGGAQLERIGAPSLIASVVSVGMVREMAGFMLGIILSGRLAAAFAAELGTMQAGEEIDALRVLGVDPVGYLVMPRLLALLAVGALLWVFAAFVGLVAGGLVAVGVYGVPVGEYVNKAQTSLNPTHVSIGLFKSMLYVTLLVIAGCRQGFYAGRSTEAVGDAVTTAVVKALVWIVVAASVSTMVFQSLGL